MIYRKKDKTRIAYDEGRQNIRLRVKQISDQVLNELLAKHDDDFHGALLRKRLLLVSADDKVIAETFRKIIEEL